MQENNDIKITAIEIIQLLQHSATREDLSDMRKETKQEFTDLRREMKEEFAAVRSEFVAVRSEMKEESASVRSEMKEEFAAVRSEMREDFKYLNDKIDGFATKNTIRNWGISFILIMVGGFYWLSKQSPAVGSAVGAAVVNQIDKQVTK